MTPPPAAPSEATRLSELSPQQWKSGVAAWLGWLFDGLDMHLYTLVATPFVAQLLAVDDQRDATVGYHGSLIQAAFPIKEFQPADTAAWQAAAERFRRLLP